jgi:hypothetical protein
MFKGYNDPEIQTPKFVIIKNNKLELIEDKKILSILGFFKAKFPIKIIIQKLEYCHKNPG